MPLSLTVLIPYFLYTLLILYPLHDFGLVYTILVYILTSVTNPSLFDRRRPHLDRGVVLLVRDVLEGVNVCLAEVLSLIQLFLGRERVDAER